ncbi:SRPBCC family protein [Winogradskyella flava]|uniref:SRPBCC family protein n=1 Tax=Winogradskyella flava TaxID=1884876 RepID=A0A842IVE4_9FLAO|nr:SRPBCC family protein [Winogradskyella flava]MBC2845716.1 SRPBCC family protein [Winogradskyella flava]
MFKNQKLSIIMVLLLVVVSAQEAVAQKKVQKFTVSKVIPHSAEEVWKIVGVDYGAVAYSHPKIMSSDYVNGSLKAEEGAERVCYFNKKQTRLLKERMLSYDPENMTFINQVFQADKFPVDPKYTRGIYKVEPIDDGSCRFVFNMEYRTKPAFMGAFAKGKFKRLIRDYAISIEHYIATGEKVTKENFRKVKKAYKARQKKK